MISLLIFLILSNGGMFANAGFASKSIDPSPYQNIYEGCYINVSFILRTAFLLSIGVTHHIWVHTILILHHFSVVILTVVLSFIHHLASFSIVHHHHSFLVPIVHAIHVHFRVYNICNTHKFHYLPPSSCDHLLQTFKFVNFIYYLYESFL